MYESQWFIFCIFPSPIHPLLHAPFCNHSFILCICESISVLFAYLFLDSKCKWRHTVFSFPVWLVSLRFSSAQFSRLGCCPLIPSTKMNILLRSPIPLGFSSCGRSGTLASLFISSISKTLNWFVSILQWWLGFFCIIMNSYWTYLMYLNVL